ncbi:MAG: WecB/TagA/CpsF family glycosyltransferase [Amaricoccus sp.]|uniref:WecB/TagA/CpsF family glycosyltransferase n=1 Tax=Amaricoccus sp. TaxID=1872485 RepID=UPI0039E6D1EC
MRHNTISVEAAEELDAAPAVPAGFNRHPVPWINLLGVRVSAVNMGSAVSSILDAIAAGRKGYVCLRDVHGVVRCQNNEELQRAHNRAFLVTPDGMPLVWALKGAGHKTADRVYGPDLMLALFDQGRKAGLRHFLYGTTPEVLEKLAARLTEAYPGAEIVGTYAPPFRPLTEAETEEVAAGINATKADIVWVGLSTPKQELWMAEMRPALDAGMLMGVGAAFDFHAGSKKQAPRFVQRSGFEWLFRLASEPRRLFGRYAVVVPSFLGLVALQVSGLREFPMSRPADVPPRAASQTERPV